MATVTRKIFLMLLVWSLCASAATIIAFAQGKPAPVKSPVPNAEQKPEMEEVLKIETNLVPLRVTVTDQLGKAVTELKNRVLTSTKTGLSRRLITSAPSRCPQAGDSSSTAAAA